MLFAPRPLSSVSRWGRLRAWLPLGLLAALPSAAALGAPSAFQVRVAPLSAPTPLTRFLDGLTCSQPIGRLEQVMNQATAQAGGALGCGNVVEGLVYFPNPDPTYSAQPATVHGGFDVLAQHIRAATSEVLLSNMFWDAGPDLPGAVLAQAVADLRRSVHDRPEAYSQGVTVRVLLGNSLGAGSLDPLKPLQAALNDFLRAGLDLPGMPETVPGFRLEFGNWADVLPHSHVKLLVIDGQEVTAGGYNVTAQHLPPGHPSGKSENVHDLALMVRGPAARQAAATFDDLWTLSRAVKCAPSSASNLLCPLGAYNAAPTHTWLSQAATQPGSSWVFPLYRRSGFSEADSAYTALLGASQRSIDLMQSQVSGTFHCTATLLTPGGCVFPRDALPVWQAALQAVLSRGITVRLLIDRDPTLTGGETYAFASAMRQALLPSGLQDHFQIRFFVPGRQHTKAAIIDGEMAAVGSYNLHYSSQGETGLSEYGLATSDPATLSALERQFEVEWARGEALQLPFWLR